MGVVNAGVVVAISRRGLAQQRQEEEGDVGLAVRERRHTERRHIQPIEKISPKTTGGNLSLQINFACRDEAHIKRNLLIRA